MDKRRKFMTAVWGLALGFNIALTISLILILARGLDKGSLNCDATLLLILDMVTIGMACIELCKLLIYPKKCRIAKTFYIVAATITACVSLTLIAYACITAKYPDKEFPKLWIVLLVFSTGYSVYNSVQAKYN